MRRAFAALVLLCLTATPTLGQTEADPSVGLLLFSDVTYLRTERDVASGFSLGQVVGHLNGSLSPRLSVAIEGTVSSRAGGPVATVERVILAYHVSDALRLSAGRYHTPISWWNTQFHHGLWLQTSIDRPRTVRFGTPLIPVHFLGLLASGNLPVGGSTLVYEAGLGNGRAPNLTGAGDAGEQPGELAAIAGVRFRPGAVAGLELGAHAYLDRVDPAGPTGPVDEQVVGGHIAWTGPLELVAEYLQFIHDPPGDPAPTRSDAYYAQLAWRIPPAPSVRPYVRFESVAIDAADPLFAGLGLGYDGVIAGVRFDLADYFALKGEVRSEEFADGPRATSFVANAAFVIPNVIQ